MVEFFPTARAILTLGPLTLYWYGLLYVVAFAVAWGLWPRLQGHRGLALSYGQILELVTWGAAGVIVGGRLGYVLLYAPLYYMAYPGEIFLLSQGGMSSHGGFVGVVAAVWLWAMVSHDKGRKGGVLLPSQTPLRSPLSGGNVLRILDVTVVPASLGLALGRLGNLINDELYITPLAQFIAVASPLALAMICYWHLRQGKSAGTTTGLFLVLYSVARFGEEFLREPEWPHVFGWVTWGQLYTVPLLLMGISLLLPRPFAVWSKDATYDFDNSRPK